jgi:hypothetical protein
VDPHGRALELDALADSVPYPTVVAGARHLASLVSRPIPKQRESKDQINFAGAFNRLSDAFSGFPADSAYRIRKVLRYLAQYDDDVAGTLREQQILVNPGFDFEIAEVGKRVATRAKQELDAWEKGVYQGGFASLINNQVREIFVTGASSIEWVPERNRKGVKTAVPVKAEDISIRVEEDGNIYEQVGVDPEPIELHPLTYRYMPVQTEGSSPYGIPIALPAMFSLDRKFSLLDAEKRVINLMAHSALIHSSLPKPTLKELGLPATATADQVKQALSTYAERAADLLMAGSENGLYLAFHTDTGKAEIQAVPLNQNGTGTRDIVLGNQHRAWNALGTQPYLRGETDTAAFAIARITYPVVQALAENIRLIIALQLEYGANLHLRLMGIPATCWLHFKKAADPFRLENATAEKTEMETDALGKKLFGASYYSRAARHWDIDEKDAEQAPDSWKTPEPEGNDGLPTDGTPTDETEGAE